jgi:hypothetical protein
MIKDIFIPSGLNPIFDNVRAPKMFHVGMVKLVRKVLSPAHARPRLPNRDMGDTAEDSILLSARS